ncbi:phosphoenolpyruvate carboxylase 4-like isoform X1 [Vicia villosa]|uniref:phosphoenolpyruvate carboxylase 4-like isoform X1 n=1 Tax=Vicia villosa TaxID=3911 RepID=UPI00273BEA41|nr:phosphoenolpyruvate carboxylase 4-like isoform X1 [Vicia villosa]
MVIEDLVREITSIWQTDELRRQKPTPVDEARAGLNIVEQSLWKAVPHYLRRVSNALKKHTGKPLPLTCTPIKFGSWMGGDRDGNPNVTANHVYLCLFIYLHIMFLMTCFFCEANGESDHPRLDIPGPDYKQLNHKDGKTSTTNVSNAGSSNSHSRQLCSLTTL